MDTLVVGRLDIRTPKKASPPFLLCSLGSGQHRARSGVVGGFPGGTIVKNPPANVGDTRDAGSIPGSGRSPGVGNGNPLQYSCLESPMDRGTWWAAVHGVAKSQTRLSAQHRAARGTRWGLLGSGEAWRPVSVSVHPCAWGLGLSACPSAEPPSMRLKARPVSPGLSMLTCSAFSFYPPELKLRFLRNELATGSGEIHMGPNGDGSFYAWSSLTVKSGDEHHYRCVVQHAGLAQPLTVELGECGPAGELCSRLPVVFSPSAAATLPESDCFLPHRWPVHPKPDSLLSCVACLPKSECLPSCCCWPH